MEKINKLIQQSRITEVNGAATNILEVYEKASLPEDATLAMIMSELKTNNKSLTTSINKDKGIAQTEEFDAARDEAYSNLFHFVFGMTKLPNNTDALVLWNILQRYGLSITKDAYAEETSKLNSLIEELNAHSAELSSVTGAAGLAEALITAQQNFQDYYADYVQSLTEAGKIQSASEVKPSVLKSINDKLVLYLRTQAEFNAENYGDFANDVAIIIDKSNENVKERIGK